MKCFKCDKKLKIGELYFLEEDRNDNDIAVCVPCYAKSWGINNLYEVGKDYDVVFNKYFSEVIR